MGDPRLGSYRSHPHDKLADARSSSSHSRVPWAQAAHGRTMIDEPPLGGAWREGGVRMAALPGPPEGRLRRVLTAGGIAHAPGQESFGLSETRVIDR